MSKLSKTKVGRNPLQKTGSETSPGQYQSTDYLYEHPAGYVWLRVVHEIAKHTYSLAIEFISQGYKHSIWHPTRQAMYTERNLRHEARKFADEHAATFPLTS